MVSRQLTQGGHKLYFAVVRKTTRPLNSVRKSHNALS